MCIYHVLISCVDITYSYEVLISCVHIKCRYHVLDIMCWISIHIVHSYHLFILYMYWDHVFIHVDIDVGTHVFISFLHIICWHHVFISCFHIMIHVSLYSSYLGSYHVLISTVDVFCSYHVLIWSVDIMKCWYQVFISTVRIQSWLISCVITSVHY